MNTTQIAALISSLEDCTSNSEVTRLRYTASELRMTPDQKIIVDEALKEAFARVANSTLTGKDGI